MWIAWLALPGVAATWSYRVPVPTSAPADGQGFELCLDLPADLEMAPTVVEQPGVELRCETTAETESNPAVTKVCYRLAGEPWPGAPSSLTCKGPRTHVELRFISSFDPTDDVSDGLTLVRTDEVAASFVLPESLTWRAGTYDGTRGTTCRVKDGRLWVWRDGRSRRAGVCQIRNRDGKLVRLKIRFGQLR